MANATGFRLTSFGNAAGAILGLLGACYGYFQAQMGGLEETGLDLTPVQGAIALGIAGLILGRLAGFIFRTILTMVILVVVIVAIGFFFREPLAEFLGFDVYAWTEEYLGLELEKLRDRADDA